MERVEVDGTVYEVTGDPSMRTVKYVREMEIEMMRQYIDDDTILQMDSADDEEIMSGILDDADIDDFKGMMWERSLQEPVQTISLATDRRFTTSDFDDISALGFKRLKEACEKALNGTASDFMEELGIGISSPEKAQMEMAQASSSDLAETPQNNESGHSSTQLTDDRRMNE